MNWGKQAPSPPDEGQNRNMAMPAPCPRCDITKAQFNRTIQNYQKAYRKKVEGLKTELKATRNTNESLRKQVKHLKGTLRLHFPSLILGVAVGVLAKTYAKFVKRAPSSKQEEVTQEEGVGADILQGVPSTGC